ncbi:MAG: 4-(cytidine 5-diphospho)-2-C-methyl-D-erythritol kinase [Pseudomonadota bacterium]
MSLTALLDVPAPAKINLFLHIIGRRDDGYHLLQSVFALIDWADTLHFERRSDGRLQRHDLGPALPADDLCLRAARALQQASSCSAGADISIDKQVPWGAGLGGGSSDAASTLLALNRLWGLHWPRERLAALAVTLGADVPFFIGGHNAFVEGIGERLTPIELPESTYVVVKPAASIATSKIFSSPLLRRSTKPSIVMDFLAHNAKRNEADAATQNGSATCTTGYGYNDLQAAAEAECPEVTQVARWLETRYGNSRMSGSGSAVFARIDMQQPPKATAQQDDHPAAWTARTCRSLSRHPLVDWVS